MIPPQSHEVADFATVAPTTTTPAPSRIGSPTFPVGFGRRFDIAVEPCIVPADMFHMDRTHMSCMDRTPLMTSPSFVRRPAIGRESVLASHATPVDHLFSLARPAVPPPPPPAGGWQDHIARIPLS